MTGKDNMPPIRCTRCGTIIKDVYWHRDDMNCMLYIRVKCHGETDTMTIDLQGTSTNTLCQIRSQVGVAFAEPKSIRA